MKNDEAMLSTVHILKQTSINLINVFSQFKDQIDIRLGEFRPKIESFNPIDYFKEFEN
jgi:hypothetical protein